MQAMLYAVHDPKLTMYEAMRKDTWHSLRMFVEKLSCTLNTTALNVASSLILSASRWTMQCCRTRALQATHRRSVWLQWSRICKLERIEEHVKPAVWSIERGAWMLLIVSEAWSESQSAMKGSNLPKQIGLQDASFCKLRSWYFSRR